MIKLLKLTKQNCNFKNYQKWMNAPKSKYVNKTGVNYTKTMLTRYVEESLCQENVQLLGVFEKEVSTSLQHIGNLKITCVNAINRGIF